MLVKFFAVFLLFAIIGSLNADVNTGNANEADVTDRKCVSGAHYFDGCNWCVCHQSNSISCTLKYCQVYNPKTGTFEGAKRLQPPADFWENPQID